jgi:hypothetical protein
MRTKRSVSKNHKKSSRNKRRGGGCGCESTSPVGKFFIGGTNTNALMALPANNYYPLNDFAKDPNYLAVSSRQTGNFVHAGGKRRRKKSACENAVATKERRGSRNNRRGFTLVGYSKKGKRNTRRAKRRTIKGGGYVTDATSGLMPIVSNTVVGAASYGAGGAILTPPRYASYSDTNPPPIA